MQEKDDSQRADIQVLLDAILQKMKSIVTNEQGEVIPEFVGAYDGYQVDEEGNPVLQTIAGMIMVQHDALNTGVIHYSPNIGVEGETLASEVVDIASLVIKHGYTLEACTGHYVDAQGTVSYGQEARVIRRHVETSALLEGIKKMQEESKKPRLILPDTNIVTR